MRMWTYCVISLFMALLFEMAGMSVASSLLNTLGINLSSGVSGFESSSFWLRLLGEGVGLLMLAAGSGIVIGFVTKSSSENYVILPFITGQVVLFIVPFIGIMSVASGIGGWVFYITLLIMAPLMLGFLITTYEHFRGTD